MKCRGHDAGQGLKIDDRCRSICQEGTDGVSAPSPVLAAIAALRKAILLVKDVACAREGLKDLKSSVDDNDKRLTYLEAQWDVLIELSDIKKTNKRRC